ARLPARAGLRDEPQAHSRNDPSSPSPSVDCRFQIANFRLDCRFAIPKISIGNGQSAIYNFIVIITGSLWRKGVVTVIAVGGFVSLYEVTTLDSRYAARQATLRETTALPAPGVRLAFSATAYCKGVTTASGVAAQSGVAASDPELLPVG